MWRPNYTPCSETLAKEFDPKSNSLTIVRWGLALAVVLSHSFPLGGYHGGVDPIYHLSGGQGVDLGALAVAGFFVLSGFLITRSYESSKNVGQFFWKRILRIMPAFWLSLLLVAFVFGPLAWVHEGHALSNYFSYGGQSPWHFVFSNFFLTVHQWDIRNLLMNTPYGRGGAVVAWNGSLWTLIFEARCYIILGIFGFLGLLRYRWTVVALTGVFYIVTVITAVTVPFSASAPTGTLQALAVWIPNADAKLFFLFFLGACFALYKDVLLIDDRLGIAALVASILFFHYGGFDEMGLALYAYFLIWFVTRVRLSGFEKFGDPSYGTYVLAFPIQMMLAEYGYSKIGRLSSTMGMVEYVVLSLVLSTIVAYLSWHLLEKHALKLKRGLRRRERLAEPTHFA
jgi:peptidoglycan/LPS O-acetylase OafA/YrhL